MGVQNTHMNVRECRGAPSQRTWPSSAQAAEGVEQVDALDKHTVSRLRSARSFANLQIVDFGTRIPTTGQTPATALRFDAADTPSARRFDVGGELLRAVKRPTDGALLAEGIAVREGVLVYRRADGSERRELVTLDAVRDTARTGARAPVTLLHPEQGFVNADSAKDLVAGDVDGEVCVEEDAQGGFARVKLAVRRRDALDAIAAGTHELSPGYAVTLDETPGEHSVFGRYDARQIGREVNHIAIVPKGRGNRVVLRVDSADAVQTGRQAPRAARTDNRHEVRMNPLLAALLASLGVTRFDNEDAALAEGKAAADKLASDAKARKDADTSMETMKADNQKLKADLEAEKAKVAEEKGKADAAKAKCDALEQAEAARKDAAELGRLQALATKVGVKHDGLDLAGLRVAIAKTRIDSIDAKAEPAYLNGVISTIEAETTRRDGRWDFRRKDDGGDDKRKDGKERDERADADEFFNPTFAAVDAARAGGAS